jgi:hypothetical protein
MVVPAGAGKSLIGIGSWRRTGTNNIVNQELGSEMMEIRLELSLQHSESR